MSIPDANRKLLACAMLILFLFMTALHYEVFHSSLAGDDANPGNKDQYSLQDDSSYFEVISSEVPCPFCSGMELSSGAPEFQNELQVVELLQANYESLTMQASQTCLNDRAPPTLS